jgi:hypothetical protein
MEDMIFLNIPTINNPFLMKEGKMKSNGCHVLSFRFLLMFFIAAVLLIAVQLMLPGTADAQPASDCCIANGTPGCDDPTCEAMVCGDDPFCCNVFWDSICAAEALSLCGSLCFRSEEECIDAPLLEVPSTTAGTTVGEDIPFVPFFCGTSITAPGVWYTVIGTGNTMTASTCNDADYDTKISIYCDECDNLTCVDGLDDTGGCAGFTTQLSWCSEEGKLYRILVHGFGGATGNFNLTITDDDTPCTGAVSCTLLASVIPTMNELGMIIFTLIAGLVAVYYLAYRLPAGRQGRQVREGEKREKIK